MRQRGLIALVALAACNCGYHFARRGDALPTDGKRVFAPTFSNDTSEAGLEVEFTNAFREQLADAHLAGASDAPVQAKGSVGPLLGGPGQVFTNIHGGVTQLASYYVYVNACVRLVEGDKTLANTCVNGSEDYAPGLDPLQIEAARRIALQRLARRLMRDAFEQLSTNF